MKVVLDLRKSVPENAAAHYERAKKLRGKFAGMGKAIRDTKARLAAPMEADTAPPLKKRRERRWYEKYRWFRSSLGHLVIGGRDASTNDTLVKKHLEPGDIVFHANVHGAPFFAVKNPGGGEIPESVRSEAAEAAASYSKAWSHGAGSADVYYVGPEQVSKTPPAGEYLPHGAFMVYGEKTWVKGVPLQVAVGVNDEGVIGGAVDAVKAHSTRHVVVGVGDTPQGALAREVSRALGVQDPDEVQRFLPPGGGRLLK